MDCMERKIKDRVTLVLTAFVMITICSKSSPIYPMNDWDDMNIYLSIGRSVVSGRVPYMDFFTHAGPLVPYIYGVLSLFPGRTFAGLYVAELVSAVSCLLICYRIGKLADREFANRLMHPSYEFKKTYRTWVQGQDVGLAVEYLRAPMEIDEYIVCADSVDIEDVFPGGAVLNITISEGRNRQVRKMCSQCGLKVTKLLRISEGPLRLGELPPGKWRHLSKDELAALRFDI